MIEYRQQALGAIRAIVFHSPTSFSWFGKRSARILPRIERLWSAETARGYLLFHLQAQLYSHFYHQGYATPRRGDTMVGFAEGRTPFVETLSAANVGRGYVQDGWIVRATHDQGVVVGNNDLDIWVAWQDCVAPPYTISPGDNIGVPFTKEWLHISPGFYLAVSDTVMPPEDSAAIVRIYWNLTAGGAPQLMAAATSLLNQAQLPFELKVINHPDHYTRCDAGVLYIRKNDYAAVARILEKIYPALASSLKPNTPVFTKALAPGVGLAEDPGDGESFGLHRCKLFAEGLIRAYEQGTPALDQRLQVVVDTFAEHNISFDQPYLNPRSRDGYHFHARPGKAQRPSQDRRGEAQPSNATQLFLQTAVEIGAQLSRQAIWHTGRCNWIGAEANGYSLTPGQSGIGYRALGADLYAGTSGLAWFLAELYRVTSDPSARRTALGALAHALSQVERLPPSKRLGLYTGQLGVALATARIGSILAEEKCIEQATRLTKDALQYRQYQQAFDLISGTAGAISALLALQEITQDRSLVASAIDLGDELLQAAEKTEIGFTWKSIELPQSRHLTGFSHGVAGIGYALLELFNATGDGKFRAAAELAFRYERHWFDSAVGNWPDFRDVPRRSKRREAFAFGAYWCHGAPGIALSRLRAYAILNDETYKDEAVQALRTTQESTETLLYAGTGNFSLCHGLAGNAEILIQGQQLGDPAQAAMAATGHQVAHAAIERYAQAGRAWPAGTSSGETPSLMLGLAGIGYFYLRLADPQTPSLLMVQREHFSTELRSPQRAASVPL
jgi:hypothetical protein